MPRLKPSSRRRPGPLVTTNGQVISGAGSPGQQVWTGSEEHTSELQSQSNVVCRLLLEKKKRYSRRAASWSRRRGSRATNVRSDKFDQIVQSWGIFFLIIRRRP